VKITSLKTIIVNAQMRNWLFVNIQTDTPGLYGWGEASLEWKTRSVVGALQDFAPMIVGEDPTRIEHLYQKMYRQSFWRLGVIGMSAISANSWACPSTSCWAVRFATGSECIHISVAET
jgi:galactonate dehydratase